MVHTQTNLLPAGPMARRLRVSVRWLVEEADNGRIPHVKADRVYLFNPDAVERTLIRRAQQLEGDGQ